jgi:hypothetical protein
MTSNLSSGPTLPKLSVESFFKSARSQPENLVKIEAKIA